MYRREMMYRHGVDDDDDDIMVEKCLSSKERSKKEPGRDNLNRSRMKILLAQ